MGRRNRTVKSTERYEARNPENEWKTAIYARLSYENNGQEDERSLINQIKYDEDYVREHTNLTLIDEYVDNGHSGTNFDRPQFIRLMEDLKSGRINCIVVKDLSRFGRNYLETGYYLEKIFPFLNVRFIAINDKFDSMDENTKDALIVPIKNMLNEMYAMDVSRKIAASFRMKEKKGEMWYGVPPYGYLRDPDHPFHMLVDVETASFVKLIYLWFLKGVPMGVIKERLNQMQVPTPMARLVELGHFLEARKGVTELWSQTSIRKILTNPVYTGVTIYNRSYQSLAKRQPRERKPKDEWHVIPDTHDALISKSDFEKSLRRLDEIGRKQKREEEKNTVLRSETPDIFQGKFFCSDCGKRMYYSRYMRNGIIKYCNYYCSGFRYGKEISRCERHEIPDRLVRTWVCDQIRLQINAGVSLEKLSVLLETSSEYKTKGEKLNEQIKELQQKVTVQANKRHHLYEDFADGVIDEEDYRSFKGTYDDRYKELTNELVHAEAELAELQSMSAVDDEWNLAREKLQNINRLTPELVDEMISRIEYGSDGVLRIEFRHKDWVAELMKVKEVIGSDSVIH